MKDPGGTSYDFETVMESSLSIDLQADGTYEGMTDDEMEFTVEGDTATFTMDDIDILFTRK